ncbi:MAG: hypothetical protein ABFR47_06410 [Verrucomicrobiota bacterium]
MKTIQPSDLVTWVIIIAATVVCALVLPAKAIKFTLKLAVVSVMLIIVIYFLQQAGILQLP